MTMVALLREKKAFLSCCHEVILENYGTNVYVPNVVIGTEEIGFVPPT